MRRAWRSTTNKRLKLSDAKIVISSKSKHYKGPKLKKIITKTGKTHLTATIDVTI